MLSVTLVVLFSYLEETLRIFADGANAGRFLAYYKVSADAAFPHHLLAFLEHLLHLYVVEQFAVTLLV